MKCRRYGPVVLGAALFGFAGCAADERSDDSAMQDGGVECEEIEHSIPWSYGGENGPSAWASLDESFSSCESGMQQSPIDLSPVDARVDSSLKPLQTNWEASESVGLWNNGHTWQVNLRASGTLFVHEADQPYQLTQFHFHAPSEHTLNGKSYPMEVHFVHLPADPDEDHTYAVVGVLFEIGPANPTLERLWTRLSICPHAEAQREAALEIDPTELLPTDGDYFKYAGSLTTPACLEGVHWHVMAHPITASAAQIEKLREVFGHNARPVQDANQREVLLFED